MQKITLHILRTLGSALLLLLPLTGTAQVPASQAYETFDIDYCQADGSVNYNFYWPGGHVSGSPFFGSNSGAKLTFTEFDDGTALIEGTTVQGTCEAEVYVVLVGLSNWTEWQAKGGSYKEMGCSQPDPTQMRYYEIDDSRSYITVTGGDCIETGTFTVSQRPDPNDPTTPHLGAHIGIGGAGWDTDKTAEGLATWGWIGTQAEPQKWIMDFNFHIEEEPGALSCEVTGTDVDCYGDNDGTASVEVTGGVMPYSYAWDGGITDTDAMVENLAPGMYSVTVTDANGAKTECSVTIEGPDAALSCDTEVLSDVSINGGADGSAKVMATGGTMPYSYEWDNGETTQTAVNLTAGIHEVTVTDANGCETICKVEIKEPGALSCEVTGTDVDCYGDDDGTASVQVTGGVMPYSYAWDGGITDTDAMVENLAPGMYSVTVTDANGAKTECSVTIEGPDAALECETEVLNDVSINGGSDGSAKVMATGGTMPYSYMWENGETTDTVNNLMAGTYEVKVTDANGCETICKVEIKEPGALSCEVTGTDVDCYGDDDGTASVQVTGGVMPYSYAWDGGITDTDAMVENLAPGMYSVTVTDANGAKTECSVTIEGPDAALSCDTEVLSDVSINGGADGSAKVMATGGTMPYSYMWENGETTQTAVSLSVGTHEVKVTDANGCETICKVEIKEPGALSCEVTGTDVDCYGDDDGTASVQVTGGVMPYSYAWDGGITDTDAMVENLAPGMYSVTVTDANGAKTECSVTIEGPDAALSCETEVVSDVTEQGGADGAAKVAAMGGTMPYSYEWDNGETTQTAVNLTAGIHEVTVTDANGCKTICEVEIDEPGDDPEPGCETAFARYEPTAVCFLDDGFNRWGWTNFFADEDTYTFESYSGAGQCNLNAGTHSANVTVVYANGMATVTIETLPGFYMTEVQLYIGDEKYPQQGNSNTVAPGQYPYKEDGLNNVTTYTFDPVQVGDNGFWMILHSVTCYQNGADRAVTNSKLMQLKPYPTVFDDSLQVAVDATEDTEVNVAVYSTSGVQVLSQKVRLSKGHNEIPLSIPGLNAAMYILEVSTLDGERLTAKLISK